jgi:diacylglycerol kinase (ATP)
VVEPGSIRLIATTAPGDATRIAREAVAGGADLILVLGGDGTINEAVNGMVHSNVALGILPAGTANVLAMELGLGSRLDRAIERLSKCAPRRVSVGRLRETHDASVDSATNGSASEAVNGAFNGAFNGAGTRADQKSGAGELDYAASSANGISQDSARHFLAMGGAGLDASIVQTLNPGFKAWGGKLAYWLSGVSHITERVSEFEARINGTSYRCGFALASRVRNYGGDLEIASGASLAHDDFEFVLFEGSNPLRYVWYMLGVSVKRVQGMTGVHTMRGDTLELTDAHVQVDGEYAGRFPARIEIVPGALTLLMPPDYR